MKPTEALNSQELMPPSAGGMNSSRAVGKRRLLLHTQELWSIVEKQRMGSTVEGSQRNTLSCPILSCCCLRRPSSTRSQKARESGCRSYTSASQGTEQGEGGARGNLEGQTETAQHRWVTQVTYQKKCLMETSRLLMSSWTTVMPTNKTNSLPLSTSYGFS